ncbi:MAG: rRNA maturation RNase YbeY [Candidatus Omnitrophota bacterium]|nr:rRNA maturation RNase YbeY [Candidatus Omnitrophota bacterium]
MSKGEITVSFVDDKLIAKLNTKYLKENEPTDVLSFNLSNSQKPKEILGDIIVSADTARRNSRIYKTSPAYELNLYALHGCLHLLGYDDNNLKNKKIIREKELAYVNS